MATRHVDTAVFTHAWLWPQPQRSVSPCCRPPLTLSDTSLCPQADVSHDAQLRSDTTAAVRARVCGSTLPVVR
jgi:hypothetical protein